MSVYIKRRSCWKQFKLWELITQTWNWMFLEETFLDDILWSKKRKNYIMELILSVSWGKKTKLYAHFALKESSRSWLVPHQKNNKEKSPKSIVPGTSCTYSSYVGKECINCLEKDFFQSPKNRLPSRNLILVESFV